MALAKFLSGTHASILDGKVVLSGAKEINVTKWTYSSNTWSLSPSSSGIPLESIVADSLTITQDDPEESTIECETSDAPIKSVVKQGKYTISMTCADIQKDILTNLLGYTAIASSGGTGSDYIIAPNGVTTQYVAIEIVFDTHTLVCPKVQLASKIDASSLKTETVKCTISGTMEEYEVAAGKKTPFFINQKQTA